MYAGVTTSMNISFTHLKILSIDSCVCCFIRRRKIMEYTNSLLLQRQRIYEENESQWEFICWPQIQQHSQPIYSLERTSFEEAFQASEGTNTREHLQHLFVGLQPSQGPMRNVQIQWTELKELQTVPWRYYQELAMLCNTNDNQRCSHWYSDW